MEDLVLAIVEVRITVESGTGLLLLMVVVHGKVSTDATNREDVRLRADLKKRWLK